METDAVNRYPSGPNRLLQVIMPSLPHRKVIGSTLLSLAFNGSGMPIRVLGGHTSTLYLVLSACTLSPYQSLIILFGISLICCYRDFLPTSSKPPQSFVSFPPMP